MMEETITRPRRRRIYFGLWTLLLVVSCFAGLFGGFRIGYDRGYTSGRKTQIRERLDVRAYSVANLLPAEPAESDFDPLIDLIVNKVAPESWSDVGGKGAISPFITNLSLVVVQTPEVHAQVARLLRQQGAKSQDRPQ